MILIRLSVLIGFPCSILRIVLVLKPVSSESSFIVMPYSFRISLTCMPNSLCLAMTSLYGGFSFITLLLKNGCIYSYIKGSTMCHFFDCFWVEK